MAEENVTIFTSYDMPQRSFKYFEEIRNNEELCDFNIQVGGESISAHRIIVIAVIPYFRDLLTPNIEKREEESFTLPDIESSALKSLIEFAYSCKVRICEDNVKSLLSASCHLHVEEVRNACLDFLFNKLEPENALNVREFVNDLGCCYAAKKIDCYVRENFDRVSQTKDFLKCSFSYLMELIEKDDLNATEEENVFHGVVRWIKDSPDDRKIYLPDLLSNVRMIFFTPLYLANIVKNEELIRTSLACRDLIDEARNYILFPGTRHDMCSFNMNPRKSKAANEKQEKGNICIWKLNHRLNFTVQHFNVNDGKWITRETKTFHANDGCTVEVRNKIYFFRWGDALVYDPAKSQYEMLSNVPTPRKFAGASCLKNTIYLCGGRVERVASNVVECYKPQIRKWSKISAMPISKWGVSTVTFREEIFVLGGRDDRFVYNSVERYDTAMNKWEHMPSMNTKRSSASAAVLNDKIYVCGGAASLDTVRSIESSEVYNPITRCWTSIENMNTPRHWFTLLPLHDMLYAIGGQQNEKSVHYFDIYDPKSNKWTIGPSTDADFLTSCAVVMPVDTTYVPPLLKCV